MGEVEHDDQCEQEFINPPGAYGPCGCAHRAEEAEGARLQAEAYEEWRSQQWPIW